VPRSPRGLEPLCALYRPRALVALGRQVAAGEWALHPLVGREDLRAVLWTAEGWGRFGNPETLFANWNHPEDVG
jgi:molybdopterin-guanine dinucleotide biosynthesis protein A